jgi:hypothetical protein
MKTRRALVLVVVRAAAAATAVGCGSGSNSTGQGSPVSVEGGSDGATTGTATDDELTGKPCTTDADCHSPGGPGTDACSNDPAFLQTVTGISVQNWPTPICLKPLPPAGQGNCDPAPLASDPNGENVHFCDGPDVSTSPGICVPLDLMNPQTNQGICYPKCTFGTDSTPAVGCVGHDACVFAAYEDELVDGVPQGFGYCQGSCQEDSDCAALDTDASTSLCQKDLGFCTTQLRANSSAIGDPCNAATPCACLLSGSDPASTGYCSTACVIGGLACPAGWVCDTGQWSTIAFQGTSTTYPVAAPAQGLVGTCALACTSEVADSGAAASIDAGTSDSGAPLEAESDASGDDASGGDAFGIDASGVDASGADAAASMALGGDAAIAEGAAPTNQVGSAGSSGEAGGAGGAATGDAAAPLQVCPGTTTCTLMGVVGPDCLPATP